ncbi:MAG: succinate dehydrogenase, hydrophobic membrane anchor protein [Burkholderiales bacterium]|nr:succinate dehydrogenase, hydrophobic membrane anchor protein [Burkholderiales bacterium]
MVKQAPVGAHYGLRDWLLQRVTAVIMVLWTLFFLGLLVSCPPQGWADWKQMFSGNFLRPLTLLFIASLLYHAWIGVRDIWMDYIKGTALRLTLQAATAVMLIFYFIWSVAILWG